MSVTATSHSNHACPVKFSMFITPDPADEELLFARQLGTNFVQPLMPAPDGQVMMEQPECSESQVATEREHDPDSRAAQNRLIHRPGRAAQVRRSPRWWTWASE